MCVVHFIGKDSFFLASLLSLQVDKSSVEVLSFSRGDGVNVELKLSGSAVRTTLISLSVIITCFRRSTPPQSRQLIIYYD